METATDQPDDYAPLLDPSTTRKTYTGNGNGNSSVPGGPQERVGGTEDPEEGRSIKLKLLGGVGLMGETVQGSVLSVHDVTYGVIAEEKKTGRKIVKNVLKDISGIFKPGMNAIMGPTGSGKTTLLDLLAGRTPSSPDLRGHVLVDGHRQPALFKCVAGYVVQDDVVMGTLTVRENITFSANLRLPITVSREEKRAKVQDIIEELGLTRCADSLVGAEMIRGVSGGERKRTSIGMELVISPRVVFLDEPTTGLDASTATAVMTLLQRISRKGRTIIFSIHQPRYAIFVLFDRLTLLSAGRTVYHGRTSEALDYFTSIGYVCEDHNNPPDFFLDVLNSDSTAVQRMEDSKSEEDGSSESLVPRSYTGSGRGSPDESMAEWMSHQFILSQWHNRMNEELQVIYEQYLEGKKNGFNGTHAPPIFKYPTPFCTQLKYTCKRAILNTCRNPQTSLLPMAVALVYALFVGLFYLKMDQSYPSGIQNRAGGLYVMLTIQIFASVNAIDSFLGHKTFFKHERANGYYRVSAYFFAMIFCDLVPKRLAPVTLFTLCVYFVTGLQPTFVKFLIFYLTLSLTTICATLFTFFASLSLRISAMALIVTSLFFNIITIASGLLVNLATMPAWLNWIQYVSIARFGLNALAINEMKDMPFFVYSGHHIIANKTSAGNEYLAEQGIGHTHPWDLWTNIAALCVWIIIFLILCYIQLRLRK